MKHRCYKLTGWGVVVVFLTIFATTMTSCRSTQKVQTVNNVVYCHDTVTECIYDTTRIIEFKHDSIDRYIEKTVYVDTNGVWHEVEIRELTHYLTTQNEEYINKEHVLLDKIELLEQQLQEKVKVEYVEKKLNWFQKTLMWLGVCFLLVVIGFMMSLYVNKTK